MLNCLQELEAKLKKAHDEETISQLKASQLSIEVVRSQAELKTKEIMDEERVKFHKEQQILENELLRRRKEEIGKVKNDFEAQLSVLKLQVQKSDELRTKEVSTQHMGQQLLFYFLHTKLAGTKGCICNQNLNGNVTYLYFSD